MSQMQVEEREKLCSQSREGAEIGRLVCICLHETAETSVAGMDECGREEVDSKTGVCLSSCDKLGEEGERRGGNSGHVCRLGWRVMEREQGSEADL